MIHITINTYKRPRMLDLLLHQLKEAWQEIDIPVYIRIYQDGWEYDKRPYHLNETGFSINYFFTEHHGRENYYKLMMKGWQESCIANYYFNLPDDITVKKDFFKRALECYRPLSVLDLMNDNRDKGIIKRYDSVSSVRAMDLCIMYDRTVLEHLTRLELKPMASANSSGVAKQLNKHFQFALIPIYLVNETLTHHGGHESKMNPNRNKKIIA